MGAECRGPGLATTGLTAHARLAEADGSHVGQGTNHPAPARSALNPRCLPDHPEQHQQAEARPSPRGDLHRDRDTTDWLSPCHPCSTRSLGSPPSHEERSSISSPTAAFRGLGHQNHQPPPLPVPQHTGSGPHAPRKEVYTRRGQRYSPGALRAARRGEGLGPQAPPRSFRLLLTEEALLQDLVLRFLQRCWCCLARCCSRPRGRGGQQSSPQDGLRSSNLQASLPRLARYLLRGGVLSRLRHKRRVTVRSCTRTANPPPASPPGGCLLRAKSLRATAKLCQRENRAVLPPFEELGASRRLLRAGCELPASRSLPLHPRGLSQHRFSSPRKASWLFFNEQGADPQNIAPAGMGAPRHPAFSVCLSPVMAPTSQEENLAPALQINPAAPTASPAAKGAASFKAENVTRQKKTTARWLPNPQNVTKAAFRARVQPGWTKASLQPPPSAKSSFWGLFLLRFGHDWLSC